MQKAELCFSGAQSGDCEKWLLFMYPCIYQTVYQKSLKKLSPFCCCLEARSPSCSSCSIPPSCATWRVLQAGGAQGLVEGNGSYAIPTASPVFGLKARGFKKLKIQPLFHPAVCIEQPEGDTFPGAAAAECCAGGGTEVGSSCSNPGPCPGTTSVRGWRVWPHQDFPAP